MQPQIQIPNPQTHPPHHLTPHPPPNLPQTLHPPQNIVMQGQTTNSQPIETQTVTTNNQLTNQNSTNNPINHPQNPSNSQPMSWAKLFSGNRILDQGIKLKTVSFVDVDGEVLFPEEMLTPTDEAWGGACLIGYIAGKFPGRKAIDDCRNAWNAEHKFYMHDSGWMVFRFQNEKDRDAVFEKGPYSTFGRPWVIKKMPNLFKFDDETFNTIPIWVDLPKLPLECWNATALSFLLSRIGNPIATDVATKEKTFLGYARALVEVDATKPLVREIPIKWHNGSKSLQKVFYEYVPSFCSKCMRIGHEDGKCKGKEGEDDFQPRGRSRARRGRAENSMANSGQPHKLGWRRKSIQSKAEAATAGQQTAEERAQGQAAITGQQTTEEAATAGQEIAEEHAQGQAATTGQQTAEEAVTAGQQTDATAHKPAETALQPVLLRRNVRASRSPPPEKCAQKYGTNRPRLCAGRTTTTSTGTSPSCWKTARASAQGKCATCTHEGRWNC